MIRGGNFASKLVEIAALLYCSSLFLIASDPEYSRLGHVFLGLLYASLVARGLVGGIRVPNDAMVSLSLGFLGYFIMAVFWAPWQEAAVARAISVAVSVLGFVAIRLALENGLKFKMVALAMALGGIVNALVAIKQFAYDGMERAVGLAGNANALALHLSMTAFVLFILGKDQKRWASLLGVLLVAVATAVSGSRKTTAVWGVLLIVMGRKSLVRMAKSATALGAACICAGVAGVSILLLDWDAVADTMLPQFANLTVVERFERFFEGDDTSGIERMAMIKEGIRLWQSAPIIGHGADQFAVLTRFGVYSHNNYVELLANLGVVGLLSFYSLYAVIVWRAAQGRARYSGLLLATMATLVIWDVAVVSHSSRQHWLLLAALSFLSKNETPLILARGKK